MTAVDAKADHLSRAQAEQQAVINGQVSCPQNDGQMTDIERHFLNFFSHVCTCLQLTSILSSTRLGFEGVSQQVSELDSKVRDISSNQDELTVDVEKTKQKVSELHTLRTQSAAAKQHRQHSGHSGGGHHGLCSEVRDKVSKIYDRVVSLGESGVPDAASGSDVDLSLMQVLSYTYLFIFLK